VKEKQLVIGATWW